MVLYFTTTPPLTSCLVTEIPNSAGYMSISGWFSVPLSPPYPFHPSIQTKGLYAYSRHNHFVLNIYLFYRKINPKALMSEPLATKAYGAGAYFCTLEGCLAPFIRNNPKNPLTPPPVANFKRHIGNSKMHPLGNHIVNMMTNTKNKEVVQGSMKNNKVTGYFSSLPPSASDPQHQHSKRTLTVYFSVK